jgi:NADP-reducing hydrogenase subunit HndB
VISSAKIKRKENKMKKLKIGDLERVRDKVRKTSTLRQGKARAKVTVHMGTCGIAAGARKILTALMEEIEEAKLKDIIVTTSGCAGLCSREPMVTLELTGEPPVKYVDLTQEKVKEILHEHIGNGNIVKKYAFAIGSERTH